MTRLWDVVQADHDLVWELLNRLTGGQGRPELPPKEAARVADGLVALESVHEVAEELVIWPAVRAHCPDGDQMVERALEQETEAKRALNELRTISPGTLEFSECVHTVAGMARTHLSYEQSKIWPRLADRLGEADLDRLAAQWALARRAAPTRPHPHTPPRPGVLAAAGPLVAGLDRLRDRLAGRTVPTPQPGVARRSGPPG